MHDDSYAHTYFIYSKRLVLKETNKGNIPFEWGKKGGEEFQLCSDLPYKDLELTGKLIGMYENTRMAGREPKRKQNTINLINTVEKTWGLLQSLESFQLSDCNCFSERLEFTWPKLISQKLTSQRRSRLRQSPRERRRSLVHKHHFWSGADSDEGLEAANGRPVLPTRKRCFGRIGPEPGPCPLGRSCVLSLVLLRGATFSFMQLRGSQPSLPLLECDRFPARCRECAGQPWAPHACCRSELWVFPDHSLFPQAWPWRTEPCALVMEQRAAPSCVRISYTIFLEQMRFLFIYFLFFGEFSHLELPKP